MNVELKEFINSSSPSKNESQPCREEGLAVRKPFPPLDMRTLCACPPNVLRTSPQRL